MSDWIPDRDNSLARIAVNLERLAIIAEWHMNRMEKADADAPHRPNLSGKERRAIRRLINDAMSGAIPEKEVMDVLGSLLKAADA
jgi:hypothetical protein